jgi:GntR family transcriptional regulator
MNVDVDFRSHVPIYLQILEQIKGLVVSGALRPGDQLPTVRQMAADLRVNFNTVARAYRILDEAGFISTQQGRGTYVIEPPDREQIEGLRQASLDGLARTFLANAARMGVAPDEVDRLLGKLLSRWRSTGSPPDDGEENRRGEGSGQKD